MKTLRLAFRGLLVLSLISGAACGDDSEDDTPSETRDSGASPGSDAGSATDSGTANNDAGRDASTAPAIDAGRDASAVPGNDAGPSADSGAPDSSAAAAKNIVETALADGRFTTLAKALTDANLVAALQGAGPFTVFAPTDAAFEALGQATLGALTVEQLTTILKYHVVSGEVLSTALKAGPVKTLSGLSAFVSTTGGAKINAASVTTADVRASNGVIHVIDKVLLPPDVVEAAQLAGGFTKLLAAATKANLASTLKTTQNITVFAPTDAAFDTLGQATVDGLSAGQLGDVLKYHVLAQKVLSTELVAGSVPSLLTGKSLTISLAGGAKVNDASVVIADVVTTNGVIHVIDKVLLPPQ
jgi:transforming growth factor-beta-induced protein